MVQKSGRNQDFKKKNDEGRQQNDELTKGGLSSKWKCLQANKHLLSLKKGRLHLKFYF